MAKHKYGKMYQKKDFGIKGKNIEKDDPIHGGEVKESHILVE